MKAKKFKLPTGLSEKRKFVLTIGDEGAILICAEGNKLTKRLFVTSPSSSEFVDYVSSIPNAPIYVLVDVVDQAYIHHTLPPVSPLNIAKLVKRKLQKDFDPEDVKAAVQLGREKSGRRDWNYLFVSIRNIPPFSDWINTIAELPNRLEGIYLLPMEVEGYLTDLKKVVFLESQQKHAEWQIIVSHNRVGGFRQIVFKNNRIVFTRIAQPIGGLAPDVIAGNIEQETLNTIEYIRRLGYEDKSGLEIYIICSREVKTALDNHTLPVTSFVAVTPHEISIQMGLQNTAEESDRFGDVILGMHFITSKKHRLKLHTNYTQKIYSILKLIQMSRVAAGIMAIGLLAYSAMTYLSVSDVEEKIQQMQVTRAAAEEKLARVGSLKQQFKEDPEWIREVSSLHQALSKDDLAPLNIVKQFSEIRGFNTMSSSINIKQSENAAKPDSLDFGLELRFIKNPTSTVDRLLEDLDLYTDDVKRKFRNYNVTFSGLPNANDMQLDFSNANTSKEGDFITLNIKITGPNF